MGAIQSALNQSIGTVGAVVRFLPSTEEAIVKRKLQKQEERLDTAITQLQEGTLVPKGISGTEAAEYETETANQLLNELKEVQIERAKRGEGSFEKVFETKDIKARYNEDYDGGPKLSSYEDQIKNRINANKKAEEKFISQSKQRNEYNNIVKQLGGKV